MDIEPIRYTEYTAFKERKQIIDKVNEIVDYINVRLDYLKNPIRKIPLTLTLENVQPNDNYRYNFDENINDDDLIIIFGRDKRDGYNVLNFSVCISMKTDFYHTNGLGIIASSYMDCDNTDGLYISYHRVYFDANGKWLRIYRDTVNYKSLDNNSKTTTNVSNNFDIFAYIIRGVEE